MPSPPPDPTTTTIASDSTPPASTLATTNKSLASTDRRTLLSILPCFYSLTLLVAYLSSGLNQTLFVDVSAFMYLEKVYCLSLVLPTISIPPLDFFPYSIFYGLVLYLSNDGKQPTMTDAMNNLRHNKTTVSVTPDTPCKPIETYRQMLCSSQNIVAWHRSHSRLLPMLHHRTVEPNGANDGEQPVSIEYQLLSYSSVSSEAIIPFEAFYIVSQDFT